MSQNGKQVKPRYTHMQVKHTYSLEGASLGTEPSKNHWG